MLSTLLLQGCYQRSHRWPRKLRAVLPGGLSRGDASCHGQKTGWAWPSTRPPRVRRDGKHKWCSNFHLNALNGRNYDFSINNTLICRIQLCAAGNGTSWGLGGAGNQWEFRGEDPGGKWRCTRTRQDGRGWVAGRGGMVAAWNRTILGSISQAYRMIQVKGISGVLQFSHLIHTESVWPGQTTLLNALSIRILKTSKDGDNTSG